MRRTLALALLLAACGDPSSTSDAATDRDAAVDRDAAIDRDATVDRDAAPVDAGPLPDPCPPIAVESTAIDGFAGSTYGWSDSRCAPRSAHMVTNGATDPSGHQGGYLRRYAYRLSDGSTRTCDGSSDTHPGFGYTVTHFADTSSSSRDVAGTESAWIGRHHAFHEYHWDAVPIDGRSVAVTIRWTFATGRDHPVWAITYDLTGVPADAVNADTRSPYGDIQWDGGEGVDVDGVGWGDRRVFRSLDSPVTLASGWDYTAESTIPHVIEWSVAADAEMGLVQTQTWMQHDAGGYWFYAHWGMRDEDGPMPEDWNWTYQLNQYEIPFVLSSKRMAWGANYGAVGQRSYNAYGDDRTLSGWPYQSYAVSVVLGEHTRAPVEAAIDAMEAVQSTTITATSGTLATMVPAGVGRTDLVATSPAGWDPVHAAWRGAIDGDAWLVLAIDTGGATLAAPTFVVEGAGPSFFVRLDGRQLAEDREVFVSVDDRGTAWITLRAPITGRATLSIEPYAI